MESPHTTTRQRLRISLLLVLVGTAALSIGVINAEEEVAKRVQHLQHKRVEVLRQLLEITRQQVEQGEAPVEKQFEASRQLLAAKLELAVEPAERVAILRRMVDEMRKAEALVKDRYKDGTAGFEEVLRLEVERLEVEIMLAREAGSK